MGNNRTPIDDIRDLMKEVREKDYNEIIVKETERNIKID